MSAASEPDAWAAPRLRDAVDWATPSVSFEFFPPKTDEGVANLLERVARLRQLRPAWVDVTWGADGQHNERSIALAATLQAELRLPVQLHLTCSNVPRAAVVDTLRRARAAGIRNILALRGDPPIAGIRPERDGDGSGEDHGGEPLQHAVDLVRLIRVEHGDYFGVAVAGYPEGHYESASFDADIAHLKAKVAAGADFVVTQLFYDADIYAMFLRECHEAGITCPIVAGVMPVTSFERFNRITHLTQVIVPEDMVRALYEVKMDDEKVRAFGVAYVAKMIAALLEAGVKHFHFYTLNLEKAVESILQRVPILGPPAADLPWVQMDRDVHRSPAAIGRYRARLLYKHTTEFDWDEFTHERWGDARSAAYMSMLDDVWYASLQNSRIRRDLDLDAAKVRAPEDVKSFFVAFVKGDLRALPWTPEPMELESGVIRDDLVALNQAGLLTISSQPAVDGAPSTHALYGWGPEGGQVYQKAFVEFFCAPELWERVRPRLPTRFSYVAVQATGEARCSAGFKRCTLTWGVFADMEVVESTVLDREAMLLWRDQAFQLWLTSWAGRQSAGSAARAALQTVHDTFWLVNVVDNAYRADGGPGLFSVLRELVAVA